MSMVETPPAPALESRFVLPFMNSTREVFSTMVGVSTTILEPHPKANTGTKYDVSGIIGFSGEIIGSVTISFQMDAAVAVVKSFTGVEIISNSADFADAIGELANMIAGSAKINLDAAADITVPTVILGRGHTAARLRDVPCIVIPCQTPFGNFAVEVNIKPSLTPQCRIRKI